MANNAINSNEKLYINHYNTIFENLWKKSIDINDRIKDIEKDNYADVEIIPNPSRISKNYLKNYLNMLKSEILLILSSSIALFRIESE